MTRPEHGATLGIDVGFSKRRRSTGFSLLQWDEASAHFTLAPAGTDEGDRRAALDRLLSADLPPLAVALDGPLTKGLVRVQHYRTAEALLSQGVFQERGKPGQTSSPTGLRLHEHATRLAELVLDFERTGRVCLAPARHPEAIHEKAIVEALPNQFLAALLPEDRLPLLHRDASDRYWEACIEAGCLDGVLNHLLPGRTADPAFADMTNHDDRAAVVCALTALCALVDEAVGVGDPVDGDIVLPAHELWGRTMDAPLPWMERALRESLALVRSRHPRGAVARVTWGRVDGWRRLAR